MLNAVLWLLFRPDDHRSTTLNGRKTAGDYRRHWADDVRSVFLLTYSSSANSIESEFAVPRFALNSTEHHSHEHGAAIDADIRWHDRHGSPERKFTANSKTRRCLRAAGAVIAAAIVIQRSLSRTSAI
ncbi:hypothetical protein AB0C34_26645 [Nocardia sp. NPDC049220]|uniref:hypothetical protein n=1 Tax=Nocardia sp. NPDC049220 TaxID=3155273 RepID=UPI0033ECECFB